jgi:hypothetical protein
LLRRRRRTPLYLTRPLLQLLEQRLRGLQVASGEAFGEPGVDWREEVARVGALALIAPQVREARRRAQLERARPLLTGDGEGAVVAAARVVGGAGREEQVAVEAMEVSVEEGLPSLCGDDQGGRDRALRLGELAGGSLCFGQNVKEYGRTGLASRLADERHAVQDLGERDLGERSGIAGHDAGCGVVGAAEAEPKGKALRLAQCDHPLLGGSHNRP